MSIDISKLHTTDLGEARIRHNLSLAVEDVIAWCKDAVRTYGADGARVERRGKNWYITGAGFVLTINAHSHTVITAHPRD